MACTLPVPAAATLLVPAAVALLVATGAAAVDKPNGFIAEDEAGTGGALVPPDDARPKGASVGAATAPRPRSFLSLRPLVRAHHGTTATAHRRPICLL